ncbi:TonB-dependent receptor [Terriglobus roseus]|uniref:Carboxypeptidase regulatory-like domain-containing protein n=1 Tax=Terriglobus roseus TaxID=392734 RepID=A0A1G7PWF9_9BACT|nr:TonB-dependent receptor [Terriglobus roseus]SDF90594.1 Carboxypeptidase regulatory-like domain-containing protein [Terriglobus roseus]
MSMFTKRSHLALFASAVLVGSVTAGAQTYRGGIGGTVVDASGAAIPQAKIVLKNTETGETRTTNSTQAGTYVFQDLQLGTYAVTISAPGFGDLTLNKIDVNPGAVTPANGKMSVGTSEVVVDVAADTTSEIQTLSSANNAVIGSKAVSEIPLNGRSFTSLLTLAPGYNANGSLNGARSNQINYQIDGTDNNDIWQGGTAANQGGVGPIAGVTLPIEAIDQFSIQSSGNAEVGHSAGGLVSLGLKTGTNSFHGSAYFYGRSEFFAANDFFAKTGARKTKTRNQQFGGSIGGPVFKDKLFFFTNYERQAYGIQLSSNSLTEPGAAYVTQATQLLARHGVNSVNPLSVNLLQNLWAGGNAAGLAANTNNYVETHQRHGYSDNFVGNLNYILSPKQTIRLQAFVGTGRQAEPANSTSTYWYYQVAPDITQSFSLSDNWAPTDRLSNQVIIATGIFNQTFNDLRHDFNMPGLGLNTGVTSPALFGAPSITMGSFDTVGVTQPLGRKDYTGHITDAATWVKGAHQIRFGGEFRRSYIDLQYQSGVRGNFTFNGYASQNTTLGAGVTGWSSSKTTAQVCGTPNATATASCGGVNDYSYIGSHNEVLALADFLNGSYFSGSFVQGNLRRDLYRTDLSFFLQDQFKATSKLVLNYGVRYDYFGALSSTGPLSIWRPGASGADANGLIRVGTPGSPSTYSPSKINFSPRVGIAYTATDKLVIRGGYGLYFDAPPFNGFGNNGSIATGSTATGLQANPFGGVQNVSLGVGTWQTNQYVWASAAGASNYGLFSINPNLKTAYSQTFNLGTEYQLSRNTVVTLGYAGSTGTHLYGLRDANQAAPGVGTSATALIPRRPCYINKCVANYASIGPVQEVASWGASNFNSLQATIKSNNWHHLTSQLSWTYGHSLDNGSGFRSTGPIDSNNLGLDYGNATFDIRHTLNGYLVWEAPQFTKHLAPLTAGWQTTLNAQLHTSAPINITVGDNTGLGMNNKDRVNYNGGVYKTGSRNIQTNPDGSKFIQYWATAAANSVISVPTYGSHGNVGRDFFRGPGFYVVDAALAKNTTIYENVKFQFRADLFNLFNILNPNTPTTSVSSNTFGQISGAPTGISSGAPFNVQFAGKIIF